MSAAAIFAALGEFLNGMSPGLLLGLGYWLCAIRRPCTRTFDFTKPRPTTRP